MPPAPCQVADEADRARRVRIPASVRSTQSSAPTTRRHEHCSCKVPVGIGEIESSQAHIGTGMIRLRREPRRSKVRQIAAGSCLMASGGHLARAAWSRGRSALRQRCAPAPRVETGEPSWSPVSIRNEARQASVVTEAKQASVVTEAKQASVVTEARQASVVVRGRSDHVCDTGRPKAGATIRRRGGSDEKRQDGPSSPVQITASAAARIDNSLARTPAGQRQPFVHLNERFRRSGRARNGVAHLRVSNGSEPWWVSPILVIHANGRSSSASAALRIGTAGWSVPKDHAGHFPETGSHLERLAQDLQCRRDQHVVLPPAQERHLRALGGRHSDRTSASR